MARVLVKAVRRRTHPAAACEHRRVAERATPPTGARDRLRALPSVDRLATAVARAELAERRAELLAGGRPAEADVDLVERARGRLRPSLRRVLNATGVVVHTNLGRAPLAEEARAAVARAAAGYANLEFDLGAGERGSRQDHVEALLRELTGAEAALAVNNCAAATLLAAAALASGRELVVSRGQAIEIGGEFRIPDVIAQAGARMVEVGTTNRTRLADYASVLGDDTGAILRAHPSNFRTVGFVEAVEIEALCGLGVPVIDDVGSGVLADELDVLAGEPPVRRSVRAGAAVVCFSGDKLLGGPQAGLMVGERDAIAACRRHPLARAVRIDKLSVAALEATLRLFRDAAYARRAIPVLAMLDADPATLTARAERLADAAGGTVVASTARVGGGALPLLELPGPAVALDPGPAGADALAAALRAGDPPLVGRIQDGRLLLDPRTLTDEEADAAARVVVAARG
jgi:L-seryl-tRNA(Ser) seleniumtransferase